MKYVIVKGKLNNSKIERTLTIKLQFLTIYKEVDLIYGEIKHYMSIYISENKFDLYEICVEQYDELQFRLMQLNSTKSKNEV